ncbi:hypothetical protein QF050_001117 [Arthrobacter sp. SLBN-112]|nr:hypothetical protein [Arthrobacter sp. SLBN-112]
MTSHSDKENIAGTYKGGYGFAPFIASCDYGAGKGSGEILAAVLRPGNAGANSAEDHFRVFHTAAAQLPESLHNDTGALTGEKILVRTDSAGASRKFLWHLHGLGVQFSTSYTLPFGRAHMIDWINDKEYWQPALTRPATTAPMRGLSTPPTSSRSPTTRRAPNCSCGPSRCTPEPSRPCSIPTGTGSPRC